jgi:hypothetical protein
MCSWLAVAVIRARIGSGGVGIKSIPWSGNVYRILSSPISTFLLLQMPFNMPETRNAEIAPPSILVTFFSLHFFTFYSFTLLPLWLDRWNGRMGYVCQMAEMWMGCGMVFKF